MAIAGLTIGSSRTPRRPLPPAPGRHRARAPIRAVGAVAALGRPGPSTPLGAVRRSGRLRSRPGAGGRRRAGLRAGWQPASWPRLGEPPHPLQGPPGRLSRPPRVAGRPQNRGFLAGTPLRRGKRSGQASSWRRTRYSKSSCMTSAGSRPSWRSGSGGHRLSSSSPPSRLGGARRPAASRPPQKRGGTLGHARPAARRSGPAPRRSPPASQVHVHTPRPAPPGPRLGPRGPDARRPGGERRPGGRWPPGAPAPTSGHSVATTRPGRPPPEPRSTTRGDPTG